jgi:hypothetical protein
LDLISDTESGGFGTFEDLIFSMPCAGGSCGKAFYYGWLSEAAFPQFHNIKIFTRIAAHRAKHER